MYSRELHSSTKQRKCYACTHSPYCRFILYLTSSDRLDKLEKDKARLAEQLITQQREAMVKEIDMLRKRLLFLLYMLSWLTTTVPLSALYPLFLICTGREKSKNLLKRGFKKLKGKMQV